MIGCYVVTPIDERGLFFFQNIAQRAPHVGSAGRIIWSDEHSHGLFQYGAIFAVHAARNPIDRLNRS